MAVIAVDFDHTLVHGDKPIEGAMQAIRLLREKGHKILIHSCNGREWIERVLNNADIRYDFIWDDHGKPICDMYLDDKGYRFTSWSESEVDNILSLLEGFDNRKWK